MDKPCVVTTTVNSLHPDADNKAAADKSFRSIVDALLEELSTPLPEDVLKPNGFERPESDAQIGGLIDPERAFKDP